MWQVVYAHGTENNLKFTIIRPYNWIGPRMDYVPGVDGKDDGQPRFTKLRSYKVTKLQSYEYFRSGPCKAEMVDACELQSYKVTKLQSYKVTKLQSCLGPR